MAKSNDGCIEAIRSNKYKMLGIMWHPERGELDLIDQNLIKKILSMKGLILQLVEVEEWGEITSNSHKCLVEVRLYINRFAD